MSTHHRWAWPFDIEAERHTAPPGWLLVGSLTLLILLVGTAVTSAFVRAAEERTFALTQRTLDGRAARIERSITERLAACEAVLHAGAGFLDTAWPVTRQEWFQFVRPLLGSYVSDGVQGFGFAGMVEKLEAWQLEAMLGSPWGRAPTLGGHAQTVILYIEPLDPRNRRAIGFDMASESVRRAAMSRARDEGAAALSGKVTLVQEWDSTPQPGFLLYVPVYERGLATITVAERRAALIGYVFSPFRAFDFLDSMLEGEDQDVRVEVYDDKQPRASAKLYERGTAADDAMHVVRHVTVGGHDWTLRVTATSEMLRQNQGIPNWWIQSIGSCATLLLSGLIFAIARSRQMLRERLASDERLLEQERGAATILENSLEAFILINESDEVLEWNKQATVIFGWTREEVLGKRVADFIVPERMRPAHIDAVTNFHFRQHSVLGKRVEMPATRRDGSEIYVAISIASVLQRGETVFFASLRDVTARRLQEEHVRQLNATLEQRVAERTQELESAHRRLESAYRDLEAFARSVSHDLRAPLRALNGYSALLARDLGNRLTPEVQRDMDAIAQTSQRMGAIVDNLLKLASVTQREIKPEQLSLGELVQQILAEIESPTDVTIHVAHEELGCVCADPGLLGLALRNLISNAIKFSRKRAQPEIWIGATERDGERVCYIRDNGAGFDPKYAQRLFGAFQRLHSEREFEGTGLGLTIVKSAIEKNRGRVWGESSVGSGATFYFVLPAC
jgi:PAS domain S-box-containing protein